LCHGELDIGRHGITAGRTNASIVRKDYHYSTVWVATRRPSTYRTWEFSATDTR
jgi:hypothetical protein